MPDRSASPTASPSPRPVPLRYRAWLGLDHPLGSLAARERALGYRFPILGGLFYSFESVWAKHTADLLPAAGRELMVCWMPQTARKVPLLGDLLAGRYDGHIDQMLAGMRSFAGPVICRWGHEPNGNWYPWAAGYDPRRVSPAQYVSAWRYVVARERALPGTSNIRWFWCANAEDIPARSGAVFPLELYWPGDEWVDLVGCDAFVEPRRWAEFDEILAGPYARISALSTKPFWIGELGCHEDVRSRPDAKGEWFERMLESEQFPNLRAVCYFDIDARSNDRADWRLDSTPRTLALVTSALQTVPPRVPI